MTFKKFLLNLTVALSALLFGLLWVGIYQFFENAMYVRPESCGAQWERKQFPTLNEFVYSLTKDSSFDINNPDSELPIDFEEDKLSDPKEDENNPEYFDPEGTYTSVSSLPEEFEDFESFSIENKKLDVDCDDEEFGKLIQPKVVLIESPSKFEFVRMILSKKEALTTKQDNIQYLEFKVVQDEKTIYEFQGKFVKSGNFYTLDPNEIVVNGHLMKKVNGIKTAETLANFRWELKMECVC